ncbi:MAG: hypothetical protein ACTSP2_09025 [Alphaproteobacteria bacterium]
MLRRTILATAVVTLFATPALAHHCPADAKAIEAALAVSSLSAAAKAEITALKDQGMALHTAGDHHESEHVLADAMRRVLAGFAS